MVLGTARLWPVFRAAEVLVGAVQVQAGAVRLGLATQPMVAQALVFKHQPQLSPYLLVSEDCFSH